MHELEKELDRARSLYLTCSAENLAQAAAIYRRLADLRPADPEVLAGLAQVRCLQSTIRRDAVDPDRPMLAEGRSLAERAQRNLGPSGRPSAAVARALGQLAVHERQIGTAREVLNRALERFPDDGELRYWLWRATTPGPDPESPLLEQAVTQEPRFVRAVYDRCVGLSFAEWHPDRWRRIPDLLT